MTALAGPPATKIAEPGVYDLPAEIYHADPVVGGSISSSGARRLLPPSCPAKFRWAADHPEEHSNQFDVGHAAHNLVLGTGPELVDVDAANYKTKKAQDARDEAYADGKVPLLPKERDQVEDMALALHHHPVASKLFQPGRGLAEQTLVWRDRRTGIMRRAMLDWLPDEESAKSRMIVPDYKTCASAEPSKIEKAIYDHGYHMQGDWYLDGIYELGLAKHAAFLLVFQEKEPPYVVTVVQIHPETLLAGHTLNTYAIEVYRRCTEAGRWPGYTDEVYLGRLPAWAEIQHERARDRGDYAVTDSLKEPA
jgi:PDDEXK-like uncharacterized protein DUF3799